MNQDNNKYRPYIWFGIIGAFLAAVNSIIATLALGVFQGPLVAFTTPFAFALAKFVYSGDVDPPVRRNLTPLEGSLVYV